MTPLIFAVTVQRGKAGRTPGTWDVVTMVDSATDFLPQDSGFTGTWRWWGDGCLLLRRAGAESSALSKQGGEAGLKLQGVSFSDLFPHNLVKYSIKSFLPYSKDSSSLGCFYALSLSYKTCLKSF